MTSRLLMVGSLNNWLMVWRAFWMLYCRTDSWVRISIELIMIEVFRYFVSVWIGVAFVIPRALRSACAAFLNVYVLWDGVTCNLNDGFTATRDFYSAPLFFEFLDSFPLLRRFKDLGFGHAVFLFPGGFWGICRVAWLRFENWESNSASGKYWNWNWKTWRARIASVNNCRIRGRFAFLFKISNCALSRLFLLTFLPTRPSTRAPEPKQGGKCDERPRRPRFEFCHFQYIMWCRVPWVE